MKAKAKKDSPYFKYIIYGLAILSVLLLLTLSKTIRAAAFVFFFIIINMALSSYKRFIKFPVEIEFLTLGIVFCTSEYGLKAGLTVAILGGILSFIVGYNISPFSFPMLIGYILMAFISFLLQGQNILLVGIIAAIANNIFVFLVYHFIFGYDTAKNISFGLSNMIFNLILFFNVLPLILKIALA
jgi:hypothetical protein